MTADIHHFEALIETARLELDRAHRAALSVEAGEIRRGLELSIAALRDAAEASAGTEVVPTPETAGRIGASLRTALADLDQGSLSELGTLLEKARKDLDC